MENKLINRLIFGAIFMATTSVACTLLSCGSDNEEPQLEPITDVKVEDTSIKASDIQGVWTLNDENGFFFAYFDGTDEYSFCFDEQSMGAGKYLIASNKLTLKNGYLGYTDTFMIEPNGDELVIYGKLTSYNGTDSKFINIKLYKSSESVPLPIVGKIWKTGIYDTYVDYLNFTSQYVVQHYKVKSSINTRSDEYNMYYVYRDEKLYAQKVNSTGNVGIYSIRFDGGIATLGSLKDYKLN
jgi:hypothetical protein